MEPTSDEMAQARRFVVARFSEPPVSAVPKTEPGAVLLASPEPLFTPDPPFSFTYDGQASSNILKTWNVERGTRRLDDHRTAHTVTYSEPAGRLVVRCEAVAYDDFPVVEWTLFFRNRGDTNSPLLERIQSLDLRWQRDAEGEFLLHHNTGAPADGLDCSPLETMLGKESRLRFGGAGGRSTGSSLSYFNLERSKGEGLIVVVGWPGQWSAEFVRDADRGLRLSAGQELTHFKLLPGEEVRMPLSVIQFWKGGDWIRAQCLWRRWMIAHNVPRTGGKPPSPQPVSITAARPASVSADFTPRDPPDTGFRVRWVRFIGTALSTLFPDQGLEIPATELWDTDR